MTTQARISQRLNPLHKHRILLSQQGILRLQPRNLLLGGFQERAPERAMQAFGDVHMSIDSHIETHVKLFLKTNHLGSYPECH